MTKLYVKGVDDCRDCPTIKKIHTFGKSFGNFYCGMWHDKNNDNKLCAERDVLGNKTINIPEWCKLETL